MLCKAAEGPTFLFTSESVNEGHPGQFQFSFETQHSACLSAHQIMIFVKHVNR